MPTAEQRPLPARRPLDLTHLTPAPHGSGNCPGAGGMAGLLDMHRAALERELAVTGGTVAT